MGCRYVHCSLQAMLSLPAFGSCVISNWPSILELAHVQQQALELLFCWSMRQTAEQQASQACMIVPRPNLPCPVRTHTHLHLHLHLHSCTCH